MSDANLKMQISVGYRMSGVVQDQDGVSWPTYETTGAATMLVTGGRTDVFGLADELRQRGVRVAPGRLAMESDPMVDIEPDLTHHPGSIVHPKL